MYKRVLEEGDEGGGGGAGLFLMPSLFYSFIYFSQGSKNIKYFEVTGKPENMTCSISKHYVIFKAWDNQEFL